jgi:hypothetical protein
MLTARLVAFQWLNAEALEYGLDFEAALKDERTIKMQASQQVLPSGMIFTARPMEWLV